MHRYLAGTQIKLNYLEDKRVLAGINWPSIFDDLADSGTPFSHWRWCDLDRLTHVVIASDRRTRMCAGVLGLTERMMDREPWLVVETAAVRPSDRSSLPGAMLAHLLASVISIDGKPIAIAGPRMTRDALCVLSRGVRSAELHPPADGNVVAFATARLAVGLGQEYSVLDFRNVAEASLIRDLWKLHGVRTSRLAPGPGGKPAGKSGPPRKPARSGGATRRPRKATRTGRTG
jgi:hypothetical protein